MTTAAAIKDDRAPGLAPLSLKDAPSFIERQFPVGRLSAEAYKERKAGAGQTLTALGSYWKGRKPLILVRAVVLGALLPATDRPAEDLEHLPQADGNGRRLAFARRIKSLTAAQSSFARPCSRPGPILLPKRQAPRVWRSDFGDEVSRSTASQRIRLFALQSRLSVA